MFLEAQMFIPELSIRKDEIFISQGPFNSKN